MQPRNASESMVLRREFVELNETNSSEMQFRKQALEIFVTILGIVIDLSDKQSSNIDSGSSLSLHSIGRLTVVRSVQPENVLEPKNCNSLFSPKSSETRFEHPEKAFSLTLTRVFGNCTSLREVQL